MGCDIHTMAEIHERDWDSNDPTAMHWRAVTAPVFEYPYFRKDEPVTEHNVPYTSTPYSGRNYNLFAFLADVRNGRGFAGVDTGDRIEPIAEPRGVPEDASKEWHEYADDDVDLHSASWFTLDELMAADWDRIMFHRAVVSAEQYEKLRGTTDTPEYSAAWVSGPGVLIVTPDEYEAGQRGDSVASGGMTSTYVRYQWATTIGEYCQPFLTQTIPALERLAPRVDRSDRDNLAQDNTRIRLVFCFDN